MVCIGFCDFLVQACFQAGWGTSAWVLRVLAGFEVFVLNFPGSGVLLSELIILGLTRVWRTLDANSCPRFDCTGGKRGGSKEERPIGIQAKIQVFLTLN